MRYKFILIVMALQCLLHQPLQAQKQFRVFLVTTTRGWHHESIHTGVLALQQLATRNNFDLVLMEDPGSFTDNNLARYQAVLFLNTTGDILDSAQQQVMQRFIQSGKGFVGIHSASDTEYGWDWYTKLVGRMFFIHPVIQTASLQLTDKSFPGLKGFAGNKQWTDEWYEFGPEQVNDLQYILSVDETSYNPAVQWGNKIGKGMGSFHPVAWYHLFDGGRSFYTALGHMPSVYSEPAFLDHVYAGILWAATGKK